MSHETIVDIITLLVAGLLGGGGAAWLTAWNARRKASSEINVNDAEANKKEAETADILIKAAGAAVTLLKKELEEQIGKVSAENSALRCQVAELRTENTSLRDVQQRHEHEIGELKAIAEKFEEVLGGAHMLYDQVIELNGAPKYKPPERRKK